MDKPVVIASYPRINGGHRLHVFTTRKRINGGRFTHKWRTKYSHPTVFIMFLASPILTFIQTPIISRLFLWIIMLWRETKVGGQTRALLYGSYIP